MVNSRLYTTCRPAIVHLLAAEWRDPFKFQCQPSIAGYPPTISMSIASSRRAKIIQELVFASSPIGPDPSPSGLPVSDQTDRITSRPAFLHICGPEDPSPLHIIMLMRRGQMLVWHLDDMSDLGRGGGPLMTAQFSSGLWKQTGTCNFPCLAFVCLHFCVLKVLSWLYTPAKGQSKRLRPRHGVSDSLLPTSTWSTWPVVLLLWKIPCHSAVQANIKTPRETPIFIDDYKLPTERPRRNANPARFLGSPV